jgi:replication-associated recombination protein RarA
MLPSSFRPRSAEQFIGPAAKWAVHLEKLVRLALPTGDPLRIMLTGPSGVGKTQLAEHLVRTTGAGKFSVSQYNGTSFRIEDVQEMQRSFHLRDMFGGYRVLQIEEFDKVPTVAQVASLTLLDNLPNHTACIVTTNRPIKEMEVRTQRRFTVCEVAAPSEAEILTMLRLRWPEVPKKRATEIAVFCCGSVGQALTDMDNAVAEYAKQ